MGTRYRILGPVGLETLAIAGQNPVNYYAMPRFAGSCPNALFVHSPRNPLRQRAQHARAYCVKIRFRLDSMTQVRVLVSKLGIQQDPVTRAHLARKFSQLRKKAGQWVISPFIAAKRPSAAPILARRKAMNGPASAKSRIICRLECIRIWL
jgi:hypothetical protein